MGATVKRKATEDEVDEKLEFENNGHQQLERPTLKKRGTSILDQDRSTLALFTNGQADLLQQSHHNGSNHTSHSRNGYISPESKSPNGFVPAALMNTMLSTNPALSAFQRSLTQFCLTYGSLFGPSYVSDLKAAHWKVASSNDVATIGNAGQDFLITLSRYINDLQAAAMAQIRLRATLLEIGVEKNVLEGIDSVVGMLDRQIIGLGTELQGLEWQLKSLAEMTSNGIGIEVVMNG